MAKVDVLIGAMGGVALLATVLGVVFYEELSGTREYTFLEYAVPLDEREDAVGAQPTSFIYGTPDNATAIDLSVQVSFSGQAIVGGSATVIVQFLAPDGNVTEKQAELSIARGATSATTTVDLEARWADPPDDVEVEGALNATAHATSWAGMPMEVRITVEPPGTEIPALSDYRFTATIDGELRVYRSSVKAADAEGAR